MPGRGGDKDEMHITADMSAKVFWVTSPMAFIKLPCSNDAHCASPPPVSCRHTKDWRLYCKLLRVAMLVQVSGDRSTHYGLFHTVAGPQARAAPQSQSADARSAGGCC